MSLDGEKMEDLKIICVSTGTKCVNGEHMSVNGNSLNGENVNEVLKLGLLILFSRSLTRNCMTISLFTILDCHAEIVSRRCLLEFLYKQIEKFENGYPMSSSIFEAKLENGEVKGYKLKVTI